MLYTGKHLQLVLMAFAWADFLRCQIARDSVVTDFAGSLNQALILAGTLAARDRPGWRSGPTATGA